MCVANKMDECAGKIEMYVGLSCLFRVKDKEKKKREAKSPSHDHRKMKCFSKLLMSTLRIG